MHYYKKLKVFKSKRCSFDPYAMTAWSYDWWQFVAKINGEVIFNMSRYSMQTAAQQNIVKNLLNCLGIKYKTVYIRCGLQNIQGEIHNLKFNNKTYLSAINSPKTRKKTNEQRKIWIRDNLKQIIVLEKLRDGKRSNYTGPLNFANLPKPVSLNDAEKARRLEKRNKRLINQKRIEYKTQFEDLINKA